MILEMPAPFPPWSINQERSKHWTWRHTRAQQYRMLARNALNNHTKDLGPLPLLPAEVSITLPVKDNRRRDPHNFLPACKAIIDGLIDAGLAPDDTPNYITTTEPVLSTTQTNITIRLVSKR